MKLFFQFFWMGIKKLLFGLFCIICFLLPIALGIILGRLLCKIIVDLAAVLCGVFIIFLGYYILFLIIRSREAVKYCKEHNTDSLNEAWERTAWF